MGTLQNERLKDDLEAVAGNDLQKKYAKAKHIINDRDDTIQKCTSKLREKKKREQQYVDALAQWKTSYGELERVVQEQKEQIRTLMPTKEKARKFEKLCKEYHIAATNRTKAAMHC